VADMSPDERRAMGRRGANHYVRHLSGAEGARRLEQVLLRAAQRGES
jgi:hypothetical protein